MRPSLSSGRAPSRLLFVHAHPDDETLATGVAMAHHVAAGDEVHLLTCTLGEEGEVIPPELRHLAADRDDALGPYRREELRQAMAVLGVQHTVLGEDPVRGGSRYRDSGMAGTPSADRSGAFVRADLAEAAALVAAHVRRVRPSVVVTYDPAGGYAHPDHIQTHRVTMAALRSLPSAERPGRVFCSLTPAAWVGQDRRWLGAHVDRSRHPSVRIPAAGDPCPPSVVDDARVTHAIRDRHAARTQARALREHRTQVTVLDADGTYYALSNNIAARLAGREGYALLDLQTGEPVRDTLPGAARHASLLPQSGEAT